MLLMIAFLSFLFGEGTKNVDPYSTRIKQVLQLHSKGIRKTKGFQIAGSGYGVEKDGTKQWILAYVKKGTFDIASARSIYINLLQEVIESIHKDPKMQAYLLERPFTWRNTEISIMFEDASGNYVLEPYIAYMNLINGKIFYCTISNPKGPLKKVYEEPYEEALHIVQAEKRS